MISRSATLAKKKTGLFYLFVKTSFIFCTTALSILWKICSSDTVISMLYVHGPTVRTLLRGHFESMSRDYASRYVITLETRFQLRQNHTTSTQVQRQIHHSGEMQAKTLPPGKVTAFQSRVYALLLQVCLELVPKIARRLPDYRQIPEGKVATYSSLADALLSSPRAVGGALRNNPFAPEYVHDYGLYIPYRLLR